LENCFYQGKILCTFDLKDDNGIYYEDMVLDWKQAAADRLLTCSECRAHVYLAAGPVKEPYFAHYDLEDCDYGSGHETEELRKGKRLLYLLLKRSFPKGDIRARFRMENGLYSTLYCIPEGGGPFAVDYRLQNNSLAKFRERDSFYQANRIMPIYVLGKRMEKDTKQIDWYQSLLQSSMGYLVFLDTDRESITLKKSFGYRLDNERRFRYCVKDYPIRDLLLDAEGRMMCDFSEECDRLEKQIVQEKQQYQRRQEQLKNLREERLRQEEKDRERQEAYRRMKEQEEKESRKEQDNRAGKESKEERESREACRLTRLQEKSGPAEGLKTGQAKIEGENAVKAGMPALDPTLLEKCRKLIAEGNAHLVSKKYYDAIMRDLNI
jgi:competence CoiA-like predicted nuclease